MTNLNLLRKLFISLLSLTHILIIVFILSKAAADTYGRQRVPFTLNGIKVQKLQQITL